MDTDEKEDKSLRQIIGNRLIAFRKAIDANYRDLSRVNYCLIFCSASFLLYNSRFAKRYSSAISIPRHHFTHQRKLTAKVLNIHSDGADLLVDLLHVPLLYRALPFYSNLTNSTLTMRVFGVRNLEGYTREYLIGNGVLVWIRG